MSEASNHAFTRPMLFKRKKEKESTRNAKVAIVVGAAGLLLFIVGIKRNYRIESPPAPAGDTTIDESFEPTADAPPVGVEAEIPTTPEQGTIA